MYFLFFYPLFTANLVSAGGATRNLLKPYKAKSYEIRSLISNPDLIGGDERPHHMLQNVFFGGPYLVSFL